LSYSIKKGTPGKMEVIEEEVREQLGSPREVKYVEDA